MRQNSNESGFTLIEMLVSMSIFAVITSFVTANFRAGQQGDELRISAELVTSMVRRAQVGAIGGAKVWHCVGGVNPPTTCSATGGGCSDGTCTFDIPPAYGIHFSRIPGENMRMAYFVDLDRENDYDEGEIVKIDPIGPGQFIEITSFPEQTGNTLDILFVPPKPTMRINGGETDAFASIEISHIHTGAVKEIRINRISGQVSVN